MTMHISFTPIPNVFYDIVTAARLPMATRMVLFTIARLTLGWQRESAAISYADLRRVGGIASDGTIRRALAQLQAVGVIEVHARRGETMTITVKVSSVSDDPSSSSSTIIEEVENAPTSKNVEAFYKDCRGSSTICVDEQPRFSASECGETTPLKKEKEIFKESMAHTDVCAPSAPEENNFHTPDDMPDDTPEADEEMTDRLNCSRSFVDSHAAAPGAPPSAPAEPTEPSSARRQRRDLAFEALAAECGIDWRVCTAAQRHQLNQTLTILRRAGRKAFPDLDDRALDEALARRLEHHADWWRRRDWRGRRGDRPTPAQVRETWGDAMAEFRAREADRAERAERAQQRATERILTAEERRRAIEEAIHATQWKWQREWASSASCAERDCSGSTAV